MLNYDDFQPWDKRVYDVGAVYLTVLILPRAERYKVDCCENLQYVCM